eukprot:scaffold220748_cov24-Tisochrysis_lutea.AAC.1
MSHDVCVRICVEDLHDACAKVVQEATVATKLGEQPGRCQRSESYEGCVNLCVSSLRTIAWTRTLRTSGADSAGCA